MFSCSSSKVATVVVETPFSDSTFLSDDTHYRYVQSATNANKTMSEKFAMINAKTGLASLVSSHVSAITEHYISSSTFNGQEELTERFREVMNTVVQQELRGVIVLGQETHTDDNGLYTTWVAVEVPQQQVKEQLKESLISNTDLNIDAELIDNSFKSEVIAR